MKRFHAHVMVDDLETSVRFYSTLFGTEPAVLRADYAKWMLDDPRVNFAITAGATSKGLDHLGLQVESDEDLAVIAQRFEDAGKSVVRQENASCCYARGNKGWVSDPSGILWETFHTFGEGDVSTVWREHRVWKRRCATAGRCQTSRSRIVLHAGAVFEQFVLLRIEGAITRQHFDGMRDAQSRI